MGRNKLEMPNKIELEQLYVEEKFTLTELSKHFNVSGYTVREWLLRYSIPLRTRSEAQTQ